MEYVFQLSSYDAPGLESETVEMLWQRLEAYSRTAMPGMWKATDRLNSHTVDPATRERRCRRYRLYGALLIAQGVFVMVPGVLKKLPNLIIIGCFALLFGLMELFISMKRQGPPVSCRKEAARLLAQRRSVDWEENRTELRFDENGITVSGGDSREVIPGSEVTGLFESDRLWLVVCGKKAILLQKKDLISGEKAGFPPYLQENIIRKNLPYEGEST